VIPAEISEGDHTNEGRMSKVLIISQASFETSTDYLCKWLGYYATPYKRLNGEDLFVINSLSELPQNDDYALVWYRRRIHKFPNLEYSFRTPHFENERTLRDFLNSEFKALFFYILEKIELNKWVSDPFVFNRINKLHVLQAAEEKGLLIPKTEVMTSKLALEAFLATYKKLILKPLSEVIYLQDEGDAHYNMLSKVIDEKTLKYVPQQFFPSLVQQAIEKKMEIRVFYLYGKFYSMAIYSQNNKNTKTDFRNYDHQRPNRTVPYQLPQGIEGKLDTLMKGLGFNTGSIDLILTPEGDYVFLEINPEGQFGMVSHPCNYFLEREMALIFKKKISHEA